MKQSLTLKQVKEALFEDLRRSAYVQAKYGEWKVNNNFSSLMARVFCLYYPQYADRFELRAVGLNIGEERKAA